MRRAVKSYTVLLEFLIALGILPGCVWSVPTVCVTCAGAGTAKPSNQKNDKGRKLLVIAAESEESGARFVG